MFKSIEKKELSRVEAHTYSGVDLGGGNLLQYWFFRAKKVKSRRNDESTYTTPSVKITYGNVLVGTCNTFYVCIITLINLNSSYEYR